jgi:hypothetical protein
MYTYVVTARTLCVCEWNTLILAQHIILPILCVVAYIKSKISRMMYQYIKEIFLILNFCE